MEKDFIEKLINSIALYKDTLINRKILIDKNKSTVANIIYSDSIVDKTIIDRDILYPLMHKFTEEIDKKIDFYEYILTVILPLSNAHIETSFSSLIDSINNGKTLIILNNTPKAIVVDTTSFRYRNIQTPTITSSISASKEDINESLEINMSILKRHIKDKNLAIDSYNVGKRSQTQVNICYLKDVANEDVLKSISERISEIDIDFVQSIGSLQQLTEEHSEAFFPQSFITDSVETTLTKLYEGKVVVFMEGTPYTLCIPGIFIEFFHNSDDYNQRTFIASFGRIIRFLAALVVLVLPSLYIVLTKFNSEFILDKYIQPIFVARQGIPLSPFLEIFVMEFIIELLREGGLRLPTKVGQTLSIVSGIIIGDAALKSSIISPPALFVIGISVVCTFLIPNYQMALSIRLLKFPLLIITNLFGGFGFFAGIYLILFNLFDLDVYGIEYLEFFSSDMKDTFIRSNLKKLLIRPKIFKLKNKRRGRNIKL